MAGDEEPQPRGLQSTNGNFNVEPASSSILNSFLPGHLSSEAFDTISQLRKELAEKGPGSFSRTAEDVKNTQALINVALKVAAEVAAVDGQLPGDETESRLLDCLDIVQLLVENSLRGLDGGDIDAEIPGQDTPLPFHLWLIIELVDLGVRVRLNGVESKIKGILVMITRSQHDMVRAPLFPRNSVSTILNAVTTDIIRSLEMVDISKVAASDITLPGTGSPLEKHLTAKLNLSGQPFQSPVHLGDISRTMFMLLQILEALLQPAESKLGSFSAAGIVQDFTSSLNLAGRVGKWLISLIRRCGTNTRRFIIDPIIGYLYFADLLLNRSLEYTEVGSLDSQASKVFIEFLTVVISDTNLSREPQVEQALHHCLEGLKESQKNSLVTRMIIQSVLIPRLVDIQSIDEQFVTYSSSFQNLIKELIDAQRALYPHGNELAHRAAKRIRLSEPQPTPGEKDIAQEILEKATKIIESNDITSIKKLAQAARQKYKDLTEQQKCELFTSIATYPCIAAARQSKASIPASKQSSIAFHCHVCDSERTVPNAVVPWHSDEANDFRGFLLELLPKTSRSSPLRISYFLAVRRFLYHESEVQSLSIKSSPVGELCLHSLKAASRELRITTGHILSCFLRKSVDVQVRRQNFVIILECLKSVSERADIPSQETCILTLCRLAEISEDEELNIILLRLLEYLGHANPYICAVAYTELLKLSQESSTTVAGLLRPFWRSLSVTVVKNLRNRPHMAEQLCDLLGMSVDSFLQLTEVHTLPYLVYTRRREIIMRIAAAYPSKSAFELCMERNNFASIIAYLLSQPEENHEAMIYSLLVDIDPKFKETSVTMLLKTEPIPITRELLKNMGDAGDGHDGKFDGALRLLAKLISSKHSSGTSNSKSQREVGLFIEEHLLGLITEFSDTVNDVRIRYSNMEKKRNIIAIGEMIKLARGHVNVAIPQICSCLRSSLEVEELCDHAFAVWCILITHLEPDEVEALIDQSIAIILRYWPVIQEGSKQMALVLMDHLFQHHGYQLREIFQTLPSLLSIPEMSRFETQINNFKGSMDMSERLVAFSVRCQSESLTVVEQALQELVPFLDEKNEILHRTLLNHQSNSGVAQLTRSLLDCCVKFQSESDTIAMSTARALGLIGCLDPNRVEITKEKKDIVVLSNFARAEETFDFTMFFLQNVLVDAFLSASNTRAQSFLAYGMQALMSASHITTEITTPSDDLEKNEKHRRWLNLPEIVRNTVTPFLTSRYSITLGAAKTECSYPLFSPDMSYGKWLRTFVMDLLQKSYSSNVKMIFSVFARIIRDQDITIPAFILPFAVLNIAADGHEEHKREIREELSVFNVLDYLLRWLQGKKKQHAILASNISGKSTQAELMLDLSSAQIKSVEQILSSIPPEVISKRAVECKSFSRALFHWEQYIRQSKSYNEKRDDTDLEPLYHRLQEIYTQIDEPDGIEGISTYLHVLDVDQQVLEHRKSGRWAAAQSWYELQLDEDPNNTDTQLNLLTCLKESGQQDALLSKFETFSESEGYPSKLFPFALEASISTGKWSKLEKYLKVCPKENATDFTVGIASALNALRNGDKSAFNEIVQKLRLNTTRSMTANSTMSLQTCHDMLLQLHALSDVEAIVNADIQTGITKTELVDTLDHRLDLLGVYISEKQYLLGLRRAAMELSTGFSEPDIAAVWLKSARLFRKNGHIGPAYNAVMHAAQLKAKSATIEHSRLMWTDGHHRKAIQTLKGAIAANAFVAEESEMSVRASVSMTGEKQATQNILAAKAQLLLAKWTDRAGQTHSETIVQSYREAIKLFSRWEKAHFYLGKHYNKIIESERAKPPGKQSQIYLSGEASKLAIDNFLRSLFSGNKFVFQSLPKILTLWLDHASNVDQAFDPKRGDNIEFQKQINAQREKCLEDMNHQLKKYFNRIPAEVLFTILSQLVARICHANDTGLWTVLALVKSSSKDRASRGMTCLKKITEVNKKLNNNRSGFTPSELGSMIKGGQKFGEELLSLCNARVEEKGTTKISLSRNLGFNHKVAPCRLVVPFQSMLTPILPPSHEQAFIKQFNPFPGDVVSVEKVLDDALVLNSLQKPRKISILGTDGKVYSLLCKPKDDLRKDQRLMEFNNMINGFLKKDVDSIKRRMYIKTYAVTPLNEECGLIEWVDNLRTLRDIVMKLLRERGIIPNFNEIRHYLNEACSHNDKLPVFTTMILSKLPPVLHEWFVEMFPDPGAWLEARLRFTRTSAVMSMVGHVLGLGDRHGENILFEESTGGILHVDFNCLFDKGLTFEKPEVVPFRLTHNMVDAFGAYGYNGM
ncbi:ATR checkpoint kinase [Talaromyces pinophilus]|uniref:Serine/threonine-protein kinase MEC1 n=1 Tax=Talaromyces pinophilus TaxID=128442 RepID=A0A0B8N003_TALPI|nr:ATR checkpoint kinase [Talaromyces pinophilus]